MIYLHTQNHKLIITLCFISLINHLWNAGCLSFFHKIISFITHKVCIETSMFSVFKTISSLPWYKCYSKAYPYPDCHDLNVILKTIQTGCHLPILWTSQSCWHRGHLLFCLTHNVIQHRWNEWLHSPHTTEKDN